uniref:Uncharacterized protein n=1 Tax=Ciona savignyi TaxID=51511 RepID=H2YVC7_CIOSA
MKTVILLLLLIGLSTASVRIDCNKYCMRKSRNVYMIPNKTCQMNYFCRVCRFQLNCSYGTIMTKSPN